MVDCMRLALIAYIVYTLVDKGFYLVMAKAGHLDCFDCLGRFDAHFVCTYLQVVGGIIRFQDR